MKLLVLKMSTSWAARNSHEAVVKLVLEIRKVDVDSKDSSGPEQSTCGTCSVLSPASSGASCTSRPTTTPQLDWWTVRSSLRCSILDSHCQLPGTMKVSNLTITIQEEQNASNFSILTTKSKGRSSYIQTNQHLICGCFYSSRSSRAHSPNATIPASVPIRFPIHPSVHVAARIAEESHLERQLPPRIHRPKENAIKKVFCSLSIAFVQ